MNKRGVTLQRSCYEHRDHSLHTTRPSVGIMLKF